jgi:hypothetical protein
MEVHYSTVEIQYMKESINDLKIRLYGEDGQGGALGVYQARLDRLNARVNHLENLRWWLLGAIAALAGSQIIGDILGHLTHAVKP